MRVSASRGAAEELLSALADELIWRANLGLDLTAFARAAHRDPQSAAVVRRWRGMRDS
jgi:hypothetical protein